MTISVCMIVKNEEKVLARALDCLAGIADEIIIVDTGSSDETKAAARRYTEKVYDFTWRGDFSAARNFAFSKASMDYIYSADADETLDEENHRRFLRLKQALLPEVDIVQMKYGNQLCFGSAYNFDIEYRPKLFKRVREFRWIDPVHETVDLDTHIFDSDIVITHRQESPHAGRDLEIFRLNSGSGQKLSPRLHNLYARELFIAGTDCDFLKARTYFDRELDDDSASEREIRVSQCVAVRCARLAGDEGAFFRNALRSVVGSPCSEICCELGDYYRDAGEYEEAAVWYNTAAFGAESELDIHTSGDIPLRGLSVCFAKLGDEKEAGKFGDMAAAWQVPSIPPDRSKIQ